MSLFVVGECQAEENQLYTRPTLSLRHAYTHGSPMAAVHELAVRLSFRVPAVSPLGDSVSSVLTVRCLGNL